MSTCNNQRGSLMVTVLIVMTLLGVTMAGLSLISSSNLKRASERLYLLQVQYSAETGADIGISRLNNGSTAQYDFSNAINQPGSEVEFVRNSTSYRGTYQVKMDPGTDDNNKVLTAVGRIYIPASATAPKYSRSIRINVKRSTNATAASVISRNVVQLASSVKQVWAKDLFVNEYIQMDKNTNVLIAENLTIAGKNTSALNCSIAGRGVLKNPLDIVGGSFTNPAQTKTVLKLAFNNCVTPPGNTGNSKFDVFANQTNIEKVQSTNIPWNYNMTSSYTNSPTGCNDWTILKTVPSAGNTNKTHYPDSNSGIATSCGTNGTVNLGSSTVTISDHAHLRANLCDPTNPCAPTFNNPSGAIRFVFIEGSLSFGAFKTAPGSSPIVFVVYGADPAALSGVCPIGGAAYLDKTNSDQVRAPAAYIIAVNGGFCANGTKFGATKSLGGVSGKNVYIATNSGTPFDLSFDPSFPVNQIPINLTWKAVTYERL